MDNFEIGDLVRANNYMKIATQGKVGRITGVSEHQTYITVFWPSLMYPEDMCSRDLDTTWWKK